jgi:hypothetical protein
MVFVLPITNISTSSIAAHKREAAFNTYTGKYPSANNSHAFSTGHAASFANPPASFAERPASFVKARAFAGLPAYVAALFTKFAAALAKVAAILAKLARVPAKLAACLANLEGLLANPAVMVANPGYASTSRAARLNTTPTSITLHSLPISYTI